MSSVVQASIRIVFEPMVCTISGRSNMQYICFPIVPINWATEICEYDDNLFLFRDSYATVEAKAAQDRSSGLPDMHPIL